MIFPCDKCGLCCKHIDLIPQLKEFDTGNGRCKNLTEDNLCAIYDKRPEICNVSKMYKLVYREYMSQEEYLSLNIEACEKIKRGVV
jgi:uncharacterized protein